MQTRIIDGNAIARELRVGLIRRVAALAAIGVRPGLAVLQVGDLSVTRDFSHVSDVVVAYRLLVVRGTPGEAYNVCSGEGCTVRQILEEMLAIAGVNARIEVDRDRLRPADLPNLVGDPAKLRKLGWSPSRTLGDALREVLDDATMEADAAR